jgi:hypothetical protein
MNFKFWKKSESLSQKEVDVLIKRLEQYAIERAMLRQMIGEMIKDVEPPLCDILPSQELRDKYWICKLQSSEIKIVWVIVEKFCKEQRELYDSKNRPEN